jgi:hypothetical protein
MSGMGMSSSFTPKSIRDLKEIEKAQRQMIAGETQAYVDVLMSGDPDRVYFAYIYHDKAPNVKFTLAFGDIITRLGSAWTDVLRNAIYRMARLGRLLMSTFHDLPVSHILRDEEDEDSRPYYMYDQDSIQSWRRRQRQGQLQDELDSYDDEDVDEPSDEDFEEIE